ncbi:hypothetical protein VQ042_05440 [Aurantimonas sp. A2-1-M11]|uniref:hypothetical protein n=1 Tax=Aurantimonas sp. A2-1-M11 TaxID=3113712 RepID=UPI002F92FA9E
MTSMKRQSGGRPCRPFSIATAMVGLLLLSGCGGTGLPPAFGAVFGLEGADVAPYRVGRLPETTAGPDDRVIGEAANATGQCIYVRGGTNLRFRAACPDEYGL